MPVSTQMSYTPIEVVSTDGMNEATWLDYRRRGIGGSDVAAIMGLSPFATARDLYFTKRGITPMIYENDNWVAKEVGHRLEDLVAQIFSKKTGFRVYQRKTLFAHPLYPFLQANVDYFYETLDGEIGILECKTCNYNAQDKWANNTVPVNYELQCRHYMSVMNINTAYIACLYGNNENEFVYRKIDRDLDYENDIIEQVRYFWEECVQKGVEPPYTEGGDLVLESIRRHYGEADTSASAVYIDKSFASSLEEYLTLREQKSVLSKQVDELDDSMKKLYAPVVDVLGNGCTAVCKNGSTVYNITYNPVYRTAISKDNLEKLETVYPVLYSEYVQTTESRHFNVKRKDA